VDIRQLTNEKDGYELAFQGILFVLGFQCHEKLLPKNVQVVRETQQSLK
jgi:hypothetical protein